MRFYHTNLILAIIIFLATLYVTFKPGLSFDWGFEILGAFLVAANLFCFVYGKKRFG